MGEGGGWARIWPGDRAVSLGLLRREGKGLLVSTDPKLLLGLTQILGVSAALAFLLDDFLLELDLPLLESVGGCHPIARL